MKILCTAENYGISEGKNQELPDYSSLSLGFKWQEYHQMVKDI